MDSWLITLFVVFSFASLVLGWLILRRLMRFNTPNPRAYIPSIIGAAFLPLSFKEALNFDRAPELLKEGFLKQINAGLPPVGDSVIVGFQLVDLVHSKDILMAKFPEAASQLMSEGKAVLLKTRGGEELLTAVDATRKGGKFLSNARKVDPTLVHHIAKVGPLIVGAAHIIAGYDNAKKLKQIDRKLDLVISHRSRDMVSELEAIYESIKEALASTDPQDVTHLQQLRFKLKRLRCSWMNQVEAALLDIENPANRGFLESFFSTKKGTAKTIERGLSQQEEPVYLTRFALNMEQHIALILSEEATFEKVTIPEVKKQVEAVRKLVSERREWIEKTLPNAKGTVAETVACLDRFENSLGTEKAEDADISKVPQTATA